MSVLVVSVVAVAWVVVVAGAAKLHDPAPLRTVLHSIGVTVPRAGVRAAGVLEIAMGVLVILLGSPLVMLAMGCAYLVFAGLLVVVARAGDPVSCGCFGARSSSAGWVGIVIDLGSAGVTLTGAAVAAPVGLGSGSDLLAVILGGAVASLLIVIHTTGAELAVGLGRLRRRDSWPPSIMTAGGG